MAENETLSVKKQISTQNVGTKSSDVEKKEQQKGITIFNSDLEQNSCSKNTKDGKFWDFKPAATESWFKFDKGNEVKPPYINQEIRDSLDKDLIIGLYKGMVSPKFSEKNTEKIMQKIHQIDNLNYLKAFKSIEYGPLGMELPEMIVACPHLDDEQKKKCLQHLTNVGKKYADGNNQRSDDVIPNMQKILDNAKKSPTLNPTDTKRLLADFRKITNRQDTLSVQKPLPPNGKIDGNFKQGNTGDCWFLAGIESLAQNVEGQKLLNDCIKIDEKGNAKVSFKGINKTYNVSARDIKCSNNLSSGDSDIRALEIAMDRYFRETVPKGSADLEGNTVTMAFELLADKNKVKSYSGKAVATAVNGLTYNMKDKAANTAIGGNYDTSWMNSTVDGKKVKLYTGHAYTVKQVDDKNIYLINPHDTSKTIKVPLNEYKQIFNLLGTVDLK